MRVRETQISGVGERFTIRFETGELVALIRNEGDREVFWRSAPDEDADPLFETSEREARTLAEVFDGTYFEAVSDDVEDALEDATIEWVEVDRRSPVVVGPEAPHEALEALLVPE